MNITSGLPTILQFYITVFLLGIFFLPLTFRLFGRFFDRGYAFSKVIGILFVSYFVWLLGSLRILPFSRGTILLVLALGAGLNFYLFWCGQEEIKKALRGKWKIILLEEFLFFLALAVWSVVRGFKPDIHGLEKFMDYGFVNSILRAKWFPPKDMWMAGETINYYYFGHLVTAVLTRLSGLSSAVTYNLMIATLFALTFTSAFSLGSNLVFLSKKDWKLEIGNWKLPVIAGLLTSFLLTLGGNLHPLWWFLKHGDFRSYWYPDATRFIVRKFGAADNTIHEFPSYSAVVADLHGHYIDLIVVLVYIATLVSFVFSAKDTSKNPKPQIPSSKGEKKEINGASGDHKLQILYCKLKNAKFLKSGLFKIENLKFKILLSFLLGVMLMTNPWDFPIYGLLLALVLLWKNFQWSAPAKEKPLGFANAIPKGWGIGRAGNPAAVLLRTITEGVPFLVLSILFSLLFHLNFEQIAKGVEFVHAHSPFWQLLVLWGFFWFVGILFFIFLFKKRLLGLFQPERVVRAVAGFFGLEVEVLGEDGFFLGRASDQFILILLALATLLIIIPEIVYVKDIYIASHHRANTMFKLTYQSFVMYSLAAGYITFRVLPRVWRKISSRVVIVPVYLLLFSSVAIYPRFAIKSFYGLKDYKGLNGARWMEERYSDDYKAMNWLKKNVSGQSVILEAVGDSYTDYARFSAYTGLPAVLGWPVHEWLWRGSYDEPGKRREEVQRIYETESLEEARGLLEKYNVEYILVGELERREYKNLREEKFREFAEPVFHSGDTAVYKIQP